MHLSSIFTLIALFALTAVHATAPSGKPSGVPSCTYTSPPTDEADFSLGSYSDDGTTLICDHRTLLGEDPKDFFYKYSDTDGALIQDNNTGFCPNSVVTSNCSTRCRDALPQPLAPPVPLPPVCAPNDNMKVRAQLKKRQARILSSSSSQ